MQSKNADFASGAATWQTEQNIPLRVVFDFYSHLLYYMTTRRYPQNRKCMTYFIAVTGRVIYGNR